MFSAIRKTIGGLTIAAVVAYIVVAFAATFRPTVGETVQEAIASYRQFSWPVLGASLLYTVWTFAYLPYGAVLLKHGKPQRVASLLLIIGFGVIVFLVFQINPGPSGQDSGRGIDLSFSIALLLWLVLVPVLDLGLPPWSRWRRRLAGSNPAHD